MSVDGNSLNTAKRIDSATRELDRDRSVVRTDFPRWNCPCWQVLSNVVANPRQREKYAQVPLKCR